MNQIGSQGRVEFVGNLDIVGVESSSYWLRDALCVGQRPPNGGWCVFRFVRGCGHASRWTDCLLDEVDWIPVTLKPFIEVGFLAFRATGVLQ